MTAYVIAYNRDPSDGLVAHAFPTRQDAHRGAANRAFVPVGFAAFVVETERDVLALNPRLVLEVYNHLTSSPVRRFESNAVAARRLIEVLAGVANVMELPTGEQTMPETKLGRTRKLADDAVITVLAEGNPKRPGSKAYANFSHYRSGMTVKQALGAGVPSGDLQYDSGKGLIRIDPPQ